MSETLCSLMNMLNDTSVIAVEFVTLARESKIAAILEKDGIFEILNSLRDAVIPNDLTERLKAIVSLTLQEMKEKAADELNGKLLNSSYVHYKEVITAVENTENDPTIITDYYGKVTSESLEYSVLHPQVPEGSFVIGLLRFEIFFGSLKLIPFRSTTGEQKYACYQFTIDVSTLSESRDFSRNFKNFDLDALFGVLGMPYISNKCYKVTEAGGRAQIEVNTRPFFQSLIDSYNKYYSAVRTNTELSLIEFRDFGHCHVDINGLFLVTNMFIQSYLNIDGDITKPFVYNTNKAVPSVKVVQNTYRFSMRMKKENYNNPNVQTRIKQLIFRIAEVSGIQLITDDRNIKATQGDSMINVNFDISGYRNVPDTDEQSEISAKLHLEERLSSALRLVCCEGLIEKNEYSKGRSGVSIGTEKYIIASRSATSFFPTSLVDIFFNRSSFITKTIDSDNYNVIAENILERNAKKRAETKDMITAMELHQNSILYDSQYWLATKSSNWLPTNIMAIHYDRNVGGVKKPYKGITFVPFGFMQYAQTGPIVTPSESAASLYGIDITFDRTSVKRVIKISNDENDIVNIVQVIFKTSTPPTFELGGDQPLKTFFIDQNHYLCLFKASNQNFIVSGDVESHYAADYTQNVDDDVQITSTSSLSFDLVPISSVIITPSRLLRYFIETINIDHPFITSLINSHTTISETVSTMADLYERIVSGSIDIGEIPVRFFELIANAAMTGEINSNTIDWIVSVLFSENILTQKIKAAHESGDRIELNTQPKWVGALKTFFRSIQKPIRVTDYPVYDVSFESELRTSFNQSITNIRVSLFKDLNKFEIKESNRTRYLMNIKTIASEFHGIERWVANIVLEGLENGEQLSILIQQILTTLGEIVNQIDLLAIWLNCDIDINCIMDASRKLHPELFNHFIKLLYSKLNTDSFSNEIMELCRQNSPTVNFSVTQISIYRYIVKVDTENHNLLSLNDTFMDHSELQIKVKNTSETIFAFGKQTYNPYVHCMFSVLYKPVDKVEDVIADSLSACLIYYTLFGENVEITDLSCLSLYGKPLAFGDMMSVKFFLPFHHNKGRLSIKTKEWSTDYGSFKLENPTVEIEVSTNSNFFSLDEHNMEYENVHNNLSYLSQDNFVDINEENPNFVISLCIGINEVKKSYKTAASASFYAFTETLADVVSDTYSYSDSNIPERVWNGLVDILDVTRFKPEDLTITINICPVAPAIVQFYAKFNRAVITENFTRFIKEVGKARKLKKIGPSKSIEIFTKFIENIDEYFATFETERIISDVETLIINNNEGIYTLGYGDLDVERKVARADTVFTEPQVNVDLGNVDVISDLGRRIVRERAEHELEKKLESNIIHNLVLATKSVKWDTMKVSNHRFFRNESPKWVKFSPDKQFFGIGFQSGVKVYIRTGEQYTFCTNLNHECVRDIYFGNSKFCITVQYEDSSRPFGHLWITSAGVRVNSIPIKYYQPGVGDYVNAKTSVSGTFKEIKGAILEQNTDGKYTIKGRVVETFSTVYDYNNYYFSANDSYLVVNRDKTFVVYNLDTFTPVVFNSINGATLLKDEKGRIVDRSRLPHCFETGSWNDDNTFIGVTFIPITQTKMRVILNMDTKSIIHTPIQLEYPQSSLFSSMVTQKTTDVHPLFNYLMNFRELLGTKKQRGIWIYNVFIGFELIDGEPHLTFLTDYNMYQTTPIPIQPDVDVDSEESITLFLRKIFFEFEFEVARGEVHRISWLGRVIYDLGEAIIAPPTVLSQYINGNYFSFHKDSVYVWRYVNGRTELTHIDINGYEQFLINESVIVYVSDRLEVGIINDKYLIIQDINSKSTVEYGKSEIDYSKVVVNIDKRFNTDFLVTTEVGFEPYINDATQSINVDSKPVSSSLCLNRYVDFNLKQHSLTNDVNAFQHGNLLVITRGNEVKIVPRVVQVPKNIDGFTRDWYNEHNSDSIEYWQTKKAELETYLAEVKVMLPTLFNKENKRPFTYAVGDFFKGRNESTFEDGLNAALREFKIPNKVDVQVIRELFALTKNSSLLYNKDTAIRIMTDYWTKDRSELETVLSRITDDAERETALRRITDLLNYIYGPIFHSVEVGNAFRKLFELSAITVDGRRVNRKLVDVEEIIRSQLNHANLTPSQIESCNIILMVLRIPIRNTQTIHIDTLSGFNGRLSVLFNEIKKYNKMCEPSNYELFKSLEINDLKREYLKFLIQSQGLRAKTTPTQVDPDFIVSLKRKWNRLSGGNAFTAKTYRIGVIPFDSNGNAEFEGVYYHAIDIFPFGSEDDGYDPTVPYTGNVICCPLHEYLVDEMMYGYYAIIPILINFLKQKELSDIFGSGIIHSENILRVIGFIDSSRDRDRRQASLNNYANTINNEFIRGIEGTREFRQNLVCQLCNDLSSLNGTQFITSLDWLEKFLFDIIKVRFREPLESRDSYDESDDVLYICLETYNTDLSPNEDSELLMLNIQYVDMMFSTYSRMLARGNYLPNGNYTDVFSEMEQKFAPLLHKYRNGSCEDKSVPVVAIKIKFPSDVTVSKAAISIHDELANITLKYKIPETDQMFDNSFGTISFSLNDIISGMESRSDEGIMLDDISDTVINATRTLRNAIEAGCITETEAFTKVSTILPPIRRAFTSIFDYISGFNMEYIYPIRTSRSHQEWRDAKERVFDLYHALPHIFMVTSEIEYIFDHSFAGIDLGVNHVLFESTSKRTMLTTTSVDITNPVISFDGVRPYDPTLKFVTRPDGSYATFEYNNGSDRCEVMMMFENAATKEGPRGFITLINPQTRKTFTYIYNKVNVSYTTIVSISVNRDGEIVLVETYEKERLDYATKKKVFETKEETTRFLDLQSFLKGNEIPPEGVVINKKDRYHQGKSFSRVESSTKKDYDDLVLEDINVVSNDGITSMYYHYKNNTSGVSGSVIDIFENVRGTLVKIHSWVFERFTVRSIGFNKKKMIIVGTSGYVGGDYVRVGEMNMTEQINDRPVFVKSFDRTINIANSYIQNSTTQFFDNCFINVGVTSYVVFNARTFSTLVIVKNSQYVEKKFNTEITSINVSKENGFVALYFKTTGMSEIWNSNGELVDNVQGECNWM